MLITALVLQGCGLFGSDVYGCNANSTLHNCTLFSSDYLAVEKDDKWGYIDDSGDVQIEFLFDDAYAFYDESAIVENGEEYYLIDRDGSFLTDGYASLIRSADNGNIIYEADGKYGLLDKDGDTLTDALFDSIERSSNDRHIFKTGNLYGYLSSDGDTVIEAEYENVEIFSNGLAAVSEDENYGYINLEGEYEIDPVYDEAKRFDGFGLARVRMNDTEEEWRLINKDGDTIVQGLNIDSYGGPFYNVEKEDGFWLYDSAGEPIHNEAYRDLDLNSPYGVRATAKDSDDTLNMMLDEDGKTISTAPYLESEFILNYVDERNFFTRINPFNDFNRLYTLKVEDGEYIEVYQGEESYRFEAGSIQQVNEEGLLIYRNDKFGLVDWDDETIIDFHYDDLIYVDEYYVYFNNDKIGILDDKGDTIVSADYTDLNLELNPYFW